MPDHSTDQSNTPQNKPKAAWIPLDRYKPDGSSLQAATEFHETISKRRTVRHFSDKPVPKEVIEQVLLAAGTAPSGAHKQPWRFIAISNPETKHKIRVAVEEVEKEFYEDRASNRWLEDLEPFETNPDKSYIDTVPWLIIVMALRTTDDGGQVYYLNESVGIATGMLLTAAHHAGLATLTHTPSPMKFLREVLDRPEHERPYMMIPMGYPADDCQVPDIARKPLDDLSVFVD
ncbi:MAG: nitroreductase family protein [Phycisphaerales bacterium]